MRRIAELKPFAIFHHDLHQDTGWGDGGGSELCLQFILAHLATHGVLFASSTFSLDPVLTLVSFETNVVT